MQNIKKKLKTVSNRDSNTFKICVITLSYNRPQYIERSFESLYKRAGCNFTHYVFDDHSDKETIQTLERLKKKYNFHLFSNKEQLGIYKSFYYNLHRIPSTFDYYVKLDSDVEILSDNIFPLLIENFKFSSNVGGLTPRVEGIMNADRYDGEINFFGGHAIKKKAPIVYGCCLVLSQKTFTTFEQLKEKEFKATDVKWGIDSKLYEHALSFGDFLIVEDLSVYHIDNTYGQRRINDMYFTDRKRWSIIDNDVVWFMKASKLIYPKYIDKINYANIRKASSDFNAFLNNCKTYLKDKTIIMTKIEEKEKETVDKKAEPTYLKKMYKITSPLNFRPDSNIKHGESKYFINIPIWAKNNPRVVIESEDIKDEEKASNLGEREEQQDVKETKETEISEKKVERKTVIRKCKECDYTSTSQKRLKTHLKKHN